MDAVRAGGEGDVETIVHDQGGGRGFRDRTEPLRGRGERAVVQGLVPELNRGRPGADAFRHDVLERAAARGLWEGDHHERPAIRPVRPGHG